MKDVYLKDVLAKVGPGADHGASSKAKPPENDEEDDLLSDSPRPVAKAAAAAAGSSSAAGAPAAAAASASSAAAKEVPTTVRQSTALLANSAKVSKRSQKVKELLDEFGIGGGSAGSDDDKSAAGGDPLLGAKPTQSSAKITLLRGISHLLKPGKSEDLQERVELLRQKANLVEFPAPPLAVLVAEFGGSNNVALFTGRAAKERESDRDAFRAGTKKVAVATPSYLKELLGDSSVGTASGASLVEKSEGNKSVEGLALNDGKNESQKNWFKEFGLSSGEKTAAAANTPLTLITLETDRQADKFFQRERAFADIPIQKHILVSDVPGEKRLLVRLTQKFRVTAAATYGDRSLGSAASTALAAHSDEIDLDGPLSKKAIVKMAEEICATPGTWSAQVKPLVFNEFSAEVGEFSLVVVWTASVSGRRSLYISSDISGRGRGRPIPISR